MNLWEDREDFYPRGHRFQRVDQEAYCDVPRRVTKVKPVGEQADYEIDRLTGEPYWDSGSRYSDYWLPTVYTPRRPGVAAPPLVAADPFAFPDLTAPALEAVAPRQMELLEWAP